MREFTDCWSYAAVAEKKVQRAVFWERKENRLVVSSFAHSASPRNSPLQAFDLLLLLGFFEMREKGMIFCTMSDFEATLTLHATNCIDEFVD